MRTEVLCNIKKINSSCKCLCNWPVKQKFGTGDWSQGSSGGGGVGGGEGEQGTERIDSKFPTHPLSPFSCLHVDYFIGQVQKF